MYNPVSTYRIQFNKDFTFRQFLAHADYFSSLGIGTIYASPVFSAVTGSLHGYNITDPNLFNREIGTSAEFGEIVSRLKVKKIGWLQDIVPNHMAYHPENPWIADVLEHGRDSIYASYFDIDFDHPDFNGKIILPFLGDSPEEVVDNGQIKLSYTNGKFMFKYYDFVFPVNEASLISILKEDINPDLKLLSGKIRDHKMHSSDTEIVLNTFNDDISRLKELLSGQHYKLTYWKETYNHLNFRRFFTISSLICLRMENNFVFAGYHSFIEKLIKSKKIQGLRLDHIDGLKDPSKYIDELRLLTGGETYIVAEKILAQNEVLPVWPMQGTTGYDFMVMVNNLLTYKKNYPQLHEYYVRLSGINDDGQEFVYKKKRLILSRSMQGDLDNLNHMFLNSGFMNDVNDPEITPLTIRAAIEEFLLNCPLYRLYSNSLPISEEDSRLIISIIHKSAERMPLLKKSLELLQNIFLKKQKNAEEESAALNFFLRCMQFAGPLMAKGIEDTAMYGYNCFIAHNEVGDRIDSPGLSAQEFHRIMILRQKTMPLSINATSTHDTKRGEDVRARLNVISEMPDQWIKNVENLIKSNRRFKTKSDSGNVPDANEEYFIYQTLTGIYPFDGSADDKFLARINEYMVKALREARIHSDWDDPDENYEKAVCDFIREILSPGNLFMKTFLPFLHEISRFGIINSLTQLVMKATCPGVPDFYQGTELWDLSMVDPDNRRVVDFVRLSKILDELKSAEIKDPGQLVEELYKTRENGRIKMWLSHVLLKERSANRDVFEYGRYYPLEISGKYDQNILAFARTYSDTWYIIIVPLYVSILPLNSDSGNIDWGDTGIRMPELAPVKWISVFNGRSFETDDFLYVSEIMKLTMPVVLKGTKQKSNRKAGVLLHITSLPGSYGVGDLGSKAYRFVDFLAEAGQTYWQVLPVNPAEYESSYSPYSISSAFAGNTILTDPEWMVRNRLISEKSISRKFVTSGRSDFQKAREFRMKLIEEAYINFKKKSMPYLLEKFRLFCIREKYWLDDYVMFLILKKEFNGKPWYNWPKKIRDRDKSEIAGYAKKYEHELEKECFSQFLFSLQWTELKEYANRNGISIIGDMSFYVSYESADVWQNPEVFKLDKERKMIGVGGAPPDYYSETGQLWNMPVYNWKNIKKDDYSLWRKRIAKQLEWFDIVRIDHFRGFSGFWEVPAGEKTAVNGRWVEAPGIDFFLRVKEDFPDMPFIAEDLGEIDKHVYEFRDKFNLPGMKVLQFAFNDTEGKSIHLPHNYDVNSVVYTGTHDNNTTRGWYENELSPRFKKLVQKYSNKKLTGRTIDDEFIRLAYGSVSRIVLVPLQDILGLGKSARLNNPSGSSDSWKWKLRTLEQTFAKTEYLVNLIKLYWRG